MAEEEFFDEGNTAAVRTTLNIFLMVVLVASTIVLFVDIAPNIRWYARDLIQP